jgi:hypothetical protein
MSSHSVVVPIWLASFSVSDTCLEDCVQSVHVYKYVIKTQFIKKATIMVSSRKNTKLDIFLLINKQQFIICSLSSLQITINK